VRKNGAGRWMRPVKGKSKNIDELICVAVLTLN
jgi:hypothetical protein